MFSGQDKSLCLQKPSTLREFEQKLHKNLGFDHCSKTKTALEQHIFTNSSLPYGKVSKNNQEEKNGAW